MYNNILEYITAKGQATPSEISRVFSLGLPMTHRHLKRMLQENEVTKAGKAPKVFYIINQNDVTSNIVQSEIDQTNKKIIEENFSYIRPNGQELVGEDAFKVWCAERKLDIIKTSEQYHKINEEYSRFVRNGVIDATEKVKNTFGSEQYADRLYYLFFYSLPIFGRTKISNWLFYGKQLQQTDLIQRVLNVSVEKIGKFIEKEKVDAIAFVPPSVPRKIQFMKELEKAVKNTVPKIVITKIQTPITVQQKSLKNISERIENAENTMFIENKNGSYKKVLIIDDFTGSGATINTIAKKIKKQNIAREVIGLTITGSINGFEIIKEI